MKKTFLSAVLSALLVMPCVTVIAGHGGDSFAGGLAGGLVGGVVAGSMAKDGSGKRAEQKVEMMQMERNIEKQTGNVMYTNMLLIFIVIMFLAVIALSIMVIRMKRK
ncbi:hypothetical protein KJ644_02300 [Candidatus Dependentiae bacterium]|nr:hypothetical protein [Candidatus Dependentiae bacterium]MBU4387285.1 hypothetical protein [Candidatus Dependentiae bacterium]MCG2756648.1 hypothetical protein [Candidatus Dependentiae bacterium]